MGSELKGRQVQPSREKTPSSPILRYIVPYLVKETAALKQFDCQTK